MKKIMLGVAFAFCISALASCNKKVTKESRTELYKVAMITDYGNIDDQSFNQATYEGCRNWCTENEVEFKYKKPLTNSSNGRTSAVKQAINEGYNIIVMPGYAFAPTIDEVAYKNPNVKFIALDVGLGDLLSAHYETYNDDVNDPQWSAYTLPNNLYCANYQEEIAGYMAGYAAVKEGYTSLGFLGGMEIPSVMRYGYGYIQGIDSAAKEDNINVNIKYGYAETFNPSESVHNLAKSWYEDGVEVIFSCGGAIYLSICDAATDEGINGKIIGVDVDQSKVIKKNYGDICITSATKGLGPTVYDTLERVIKGRNWECKIDSLGLISGTDVEKNYVQLPVSTWSLKKFTVSAYKSLVSKMFSKTIKVSNDLSNVPSVGEKTTLDVLSKIGRSIIAY